MELDDPLQPAQGPVDPVAQFEDFFQLFENPTGTFPYLKKINDMIVKKEISVDIDFNDIMLHDPELGKILHEKPSEILNKMSQAIVNIAHDITNGAIKLTDMLNARVFNVGAYHSCTIRAIRAEHVGKLICVRGTIIRATQPLPEVSVAIFECVPCGAKHTVEQFYEELEYPAICNTGGCKNMAKKNFRFIDKESHFMDWQQIRIQEHAEEAKGTGMPRWVDCILTNDIVDKFHAGEHVIATGYLKALLQKVKTGTGTAKVLHYMLTGNHVMPETTDPDQLEITEDDEKHIKALAATPGIHDLIARSIAPEIRGMEGVKDACGLVLFSGTSGTRTSGHKLRGNIHLLVMGDPSTGKSALTRAVSKLLPGSMFTVGQGVSGAGLTAAVLRDEYTGNWTLEAGALVIAAGKICVIDEFDKLKPADRVAVHETMEQQTATVDKAGIHTSLNANTSIIALANPKLGRWDSKLTIGENINLPTPLLSRFDIVFIVLDKANEITDNQVAGHVVNLHMNPSDLDMDEAKAIEPPIEAALLRKYIQFARAEYKPRVTRGVRDQIVAFYSNMRKQHASDDDPIPIVARSLEGLVRMCEARAKMALRETVLDDDFLAVKKLYLDSMSQVMLDAKTGKFDVDSLLAGKPRSTTKNAMALREMMKNLQEVTHGEALDVKDIIERAKFTPPGIKDSNEVEKLLEILKKEAFIIEKRNGFYFVVKDARKGD